MIKKIIYILGIVFIASTAYSNEQFLLKLNKWKKAKNVLIQKYTKRIITYKLNNKIFTIDSSELEYLKPLHKNDKKFKKVIIYSSKRKNYYYKGFIVYQDQNKLSINVNNELKIIKTNNVEDIISDKEFTEDQNKSAFKAMLRSTLIPGLGQIYTYDRQLSGAIYLTLFSAGVFSSIYFNVKANNYYDQFKLTRYADKSLYNSYETNYYIGLGSIIFTGIIYVWNILDAFLFFEHKYKVNEQPYQKNIYGFYYNFQIVNKINKNKEFRFTLSFTF